VLLHRHLLPVQNLPDQEPLFKFCVDLDLDDLRETQAWSSSAPPMTEQFSINFDFCRHI